MIKPDNREFELFDPIQFAVVNDSPQRLYTVLRDANNLSWRGVLRGKSYQVAQLNTPIGLFDYLAMSMNIIENRSGSRQFYGQVDARYRIANDQFWNAYEREDLLQKINFNLNGVDSEADTVINEEPETGKYDVSILIPDQHFRVRVQSLWEDDISKFTYDFGNKTEFLMRAEIPQVLTGDTEKSPFDLPRFRDPNVPKSQVRIQFDGVDKQKREDYLLLKEDTFFEIIKIWHLSVEALIRAMSQVKKSPQKGILIVNPPH